MVDLALIESDGVCRVAMRGWSAGHREVELVAQLPTLCIAGKQESTEQHRSFHPIPAGLRAQSPAGPPLPHPRHHPRTRHHHRPGTRCRHTPGPACSHDIFRRSLWRICLCCCPRICRGWGWGVVLWGQLIGGWSLRCVKQCGCDRWGLVWGYKRCSGERWWFVRCDKRWCDHNRGSVWGRGVVSCG